MFMILALLDVSLSPKTNMMYLLRHQDTSNNPRKHKIILENISFVNLETFENRHFWKNGKDRGREIPTIRLRNSWKSWIWDQFLSTNMKRKFGKLLIYWKMPIFRKCRVAACHPIGGLRPGATVFPRFFVFPLPWFSFVSQTVRSYRQLRKW